MCDVHVHVHVHGHTFTFHSICVSIECFHANDLSELHLVPSLQSMQLSLLARHHARVSLDRQHHTPYKALIQQNVNTYFTSKLLSYLAA